MVVVVDCAVVVMVVVVVVVIVKDYVQYCIPSRTPPISRTCYHTYIEIIIVGCLLVPNYNFSILITPNL